MAAGMLFVMALMFFLGGSGMVYALMVFEVAPAWGLLMVVFFAISLYLTLMAAKVSQAQDYDEQQDNP